MSGAPLLSVRDLRVGFATEDGVVQAVDGVNFDLRPGEVLAIVGESGSGKSVTAQTIIGLTRANNARIEGSVVLDGNDLTSAPDSEMRKLRGNRVAMIFQDPMTSFNPVYRIGDQIVEAIRTHRPETSKDEGKARVVELFEAVGIPNAAGRVDDYPHEFSGGMRQRAMIAMALALEPEVLIADEPTTALDVTIQAQILSLLEELNREHNTWGLLGSLTRIDRPRPHRLPQIAGSPPSLLDLPEGCPFRPRCPHEFSKCTEYPGLEARGGEAPDHRDRCWLGPEEKRAKRQVEGQIGLEAPTKAGPP